MSKYLNILAFQYLKLLVTDVS